MSRIERSHGPNHHQIPAKQVNPEVKNMAKMVASTVEGSWKKLEETARIAARSNDFRHRATKSLEGSQKVKEAAKKPLDDAEKTSS